MIYYISPVCVEEFFAQYDTGLNLNVTHHTEQCCRTFTEYNILLLYTCYIIYRLTVLKTKQQQTFYSVFSPCWGHHSRPLIDDMLLNYLIGSSDTTEEDEELDLFLFFIFSAISSAAAETQLSEAKTSALSTRFLWSLSSCLLLILVHF